MYKGLEGVGTMYKGLRGDFGCTHAAGNNIAGIQSDYFSSKLLQYF